MDKCISLTLIKLGQIDPPHPPQAVLGLTCFVASLFFSPCLGKEVFKSA